MSLMSLVTTRPWFVAGGLAAVTAAGTLIGTHPWSGSAGSATIHGHGSQVLGEKLTASGTAGGAHPSNPPGPKNPPGKTFAISGTVEGLYPGGTQNLSLTVSNPNSQAINVTALSATLDHVDKAANAPSGTCDASTSGLVIHSWSGQPFTVAKNASAPAGVIQIDLQPSSDPSCEGATFWFDYQGTASQA